MLNNTGNRLKEIRKLKRKTGTTIAKMLNISPPYYYDIEKGKRNLGTDIASELADIYQVSVDYLIGRNTSLDLTDKELNLTLDGVSVTEEEAKNIIAFLRMTRQMGVKNEGRTL